MDKTEIETKAAGHEVGEAFEEFMRAFEAFKESNDERLAEIERRCAADVVTTDKLDRINRALDENKRVVDELALKAARPPLGGAGHRSGASLAHKAADGYVRRGEAGQLRALEGKALSVASDPDGGYLVPDETERAVNRSLRDVSPIRAIAGLRQVSSAVYKKPFSLTGPGTGWVGETAARPETTTPTLAELSFPTMELYAMPAATPALLDDSAVSIDEWLAEGRLAFAVQEGQAFVAGNGVNKPRGFTDYPKVANASWSWGNIGYIATGTAGAFPASNPRRVSGGGSGRHPRATRSLQLEALRALLHDQASRRRRAGFRRHQADEVRRVVILGGPTHRAAPLSRGSPPARGPGGAVAAMRRPRLFRIPPTRVRRDGPRPDERARCGAGDGRRGEGPYAHRRHGRGRADRQPHPDSRLHIEAALGLALITQGWKLLLDRWPKEQVPLPLHPVQSVASVKVYAADGSPTTIAAGDYLVDTASRPGRLVANGVSWPAPGKAVGGIEIAFTAGYGAAASDVPAPIRQALLLLVAHWYEHRDPIEIGTDATVIPAAVSELRSPIA